MAELRQVVNFANVRLEPGVWNRPAGMSDTAVMELYANDFLIDPSPEDFGLDPTSFESQEDWEIEKSSIWVQWRRKVCPNCLP